jgi:hypothetical protein
VNSVQARVRGNTCERKTRLLDQERRARNVWSIGELIDAALDGELPSGSGPEFPKNLDPKDTIQSTRHHGQFKGDLR